MRTVTPYVRFGLVMGAVGGLVVVPVLSALLGIDGLDVHHATPVRIVLSVALVLLWGVASGLILTHYLRRERPRDPGTTDTPVS